MAVRSSRRHGSPCTIASPSIQHGFQSSQVLWTHRRHAKQCASKPQARQTTCPSTSTMTSRCTALHILYEPTLRYTMIFLQVAHTAMIQRQLCLRWSQQVTVELQNCSKYALLHPQSLHYPTAVEMSFIYQVGSRLLHNTHSVLIYTAQYSVIAMFASHTRAAQLVRIDTRLFAASMQAVLQAFLAHDWWQVGACCKEP